MTITPDQYAEMRARLGMDRQPAQAETVSTVTLEVAQLHIPIMSWCDHNRVPYIHSRTDKASTTAKGTPDFALFLRGKAILVECKTRTGKLTPEQLAWKVVAELQGFTVHIVRDWDSFLALVT